jgi:hypothetical protein
VFTFTLTPDDGEPFQVKATSRDVLVWERTTKGASLSSLLENRRMADLYRIAHAAGRRTGMVTVEAAEFERTHDLEMVDDDEPDPTPPAP